MHMVNNEEEVKQQIKEKEVDPVAYSDNRNLAGVASWTLRTKAGLDIPVCDRAWELLPHRLTELIEKGIAELNPTMDSDFRPELVDSARDMGEPNQEKQAI